MTSCSVEDRSYAKLYNPRSCEKALRKHEVRIMGDLHIDIEPMTNLDRRMAIAREMQLDVGEPNEKSMLANGNTTQTRDELGLRIDPALYAKRNCTSCYGRGIQAKSRPLTKAQVDSMLADDSRSAGLIHYVKSDKPTLRENVRCGCVQPEYSKRYRRFLEALLKRGLARKVMSFRDGERIELV